MTPTVTKLADGSYRVAFPSVFLGLAGEAYLATAGEVVEASGGERMNARTTYRVSAAIGEAYRTGTVQYEVTEAPDAPTPAFAESRAVAAGYRLGFRAGWLEGRTHG